VSNSPNEKDPSLQEEERLHKKEELIRDYSTSHNGFTALIQLLKAYTLFERDTEYIIVDGKVKIVELNRRVVCSTVDDIQTGSIRP